MEYWSLGVFALANFAAACSGAFFKPGDWYFALRKPPWQPPGWLFAPAWTILYGMNATAGWFAWQAAGPGEATLPMIVYAVQLIFNAAWSALFFGMKRMDLAMGDVIALWLSVAATALVFYPLDATAAWLLIPYLAWVSFAGLLNFTVWRLNPDANAA